MQRGNLDCCEEKVTVGAIFQSVKKPTCQRPSESTQEALNGPSDEMFRLFRTMFRGIPEKYLGAPNANGLKWVQKTPLGLDPSASGDHWPILIVSHQQSSIEILLAALATSSRASAWLSFAAQPGLAPSTVKGGVWAPLSANPAFGPTGRNGGGSVLLPEGSRLLGTCSAMSGTCSEKLEKLLRNSGPWITNLGLGTDC